jgi:hypothetical protein
MTHTCCVRCRLRFAPTMSPSLAACPLCGTPPQQIGSLECILGFSLYQPDDLLTELPRALAGSMPLPQPGPRS